MINSPKVNKRPNFILFDFDRTLIALYEDRTLLKELSKIMRKFYKEYIDVNAVEEKDGYFVWHDCHRATEQCYKQNQAMKINGEAEKLVTAFERKVLSKRDLFHAVAETIPVIHKMGIKLGIVSSNSTEVIIEKLRESHLDVYFENIFGRTLPFHPDKLKPNAFPINTALSLLKEKAENVWYVGDDLIDIDASKLAGTYSVGIATGNYSEEQLLKEGADKTFCNLYDLLYYLQTEEFITEQNKVKKIFWNKFEHVKENSDYQVLVLYGQDEINIASLLKQLEEDVEQVEDDTVYVYYNLNNGQDAIVVLKQLAKELQKKYNFQFPLFFYAVYQYMRKCGETTDNPEVEVLTKYTKLASDKIRKTTDFTKRRKTQERYSRIDNSSSEDIYRKIPAVFATELNENLENKGKLVFVLVLDNYEKLLNEIVSGDNSIRNGFWLCDQKNGILLLIDGLVCVLAGREELRGQVTKEEWDDELFSQVKIEEPDIINIQKRDIYRCAKVCGYDDISDLLEGTVQELAEKLISLLTDEKKDLLIEVICSEKVNNQKEHNFSINEKVKELLIHACEIERIEKIAKKMYSSFKDKNILTTGYYKNTYAVSMLCKIANNPNLTAWWLDCIYPILATYLDDFCLNQFRNVYELLDSVTEDYRLKTLFLGYLIKKGDYEEANCYIMNYQNKDKDNLEVLQFDLAASYYYYMKGLDAEALKLRETVFQKRKQLLGTKNRETIRAGFALAASYSCVGKYEKSVTLGTQCRNSMEKTTKFYDPMIWVSENQLGDAYFRLGKFEKAKLIYSEVYETRAKWLGKKNNSTMIAYNHIADCLVNIGEYDKAMNIYQEVRRFRANEFGYDQRRKYYINEDIQFTCDHPDTIIVDNNMAVCLMYMGEYEEALDILKIVVTNRKISIGDKAPSTMCSLGNEALCEYFMGHKISAAKHINQVVDVLTEVLGKEHVNTIVSEYHRALIEEDEEKIEEIIKDNSEKLGAYTNGIERMKAHECIGYFSLGKYYE